jgi:hypothetical protein
MVDNEYIYRVPPTNIIIHPFRRSSTTFVFPFLLLLSNDGAYFCFFPSHLTCSCRVDTEVGCGIRKLIGLSVNKPRNLYIYIDQKNGTMRIQDGLAEPFR